jgi:WD40-like Beta Propeller Repeat
MTLLHPRTASFPEPHDPEALIREARRLRRRRWTIGVLLLVAGVVALVVTDTPSPSRRPLTTSTLSFGPNRPSVDAKAFAGQGDLAFISRKSLYVLDGTTGSLRHLSLPSGYIASTPVFSHDGKLLAFVASRLITASNGESTLTSLWIANASGAGLRKVAGFSNPQIVAWSPTADVLAVTNQGEIPTTYQPPSGSGYVKRQTSLWLVSPNNSRQELLRPGTGEIDRAAWSTDGASIVVGALSAWPFQDHLPWSTTLTAYPINGSRPTVWLRIENPRSNGCCSATDLKQSEFIPVGWWPDWGVVFWAPSALVDPSLLEGGGFSLYALPSIGQKPVLLARTLEAGQLSPIVASSTGELAITNEPNGNEGARPFWQNEHVVRCDPTTLRCTPIPEAPDTISFDPLWSPDGSMLVYLVGKISNNAGFDQQVVARWYNSLQLQIYLPRTATDVAVSAARGAVVPLWSAKGSRLLHFDNDGIWLLKNIKGQPVEIAGPLLPQKNWSAYFAQLNWSELFAWSAT